MYPEKVVFIVPNLSDPIANSLRREVQSRMDAMRYDERTFAAACGHPKIRRAIERLHTEEGSLPHWDRERERIFRVLLFACEVYAYRSDVPIGEPVNEDDETTWEGTTDA